MKSNLTLVAIVALAFFWQSSCGTAGSNSNSTATQNTITANGNSITLNTNSTGLDTNVYSNNLNANSNAMNTNSSDANSNARPANPNTNAPASNANSASAPLANSQSNANVTRPVKKVIKPPFYGDLGNDAQRAIDTEPAAPKGATPGVVKPTNTPSTKPTPLPE